MVGVLADAIDTGAVIAFVAAVTALSGIWAAFDLDEAGPVEAIVGHAAAGERD